MQQSGYLKVTPEKSNGVQGRERITSYDVTTMAGTFASPSVDYVSEESEEDEEETTTDIA